MSGRALAIGIGLLALIFGAALYYTQVYAYYRELPADTPITLVRADTGQPEAIAVRALRAIDGTSSPIRFRACFTIEDPAGLAGRYTPYPAATPLIAPGWFDCFDAKAIGRALESGAAQGWLSQRDIHDGVDRVVAVFPDGRAYAWQQLNEKFAE